MLNYLIAIVINLQTMCILKQFSIDIDIGYWVYWRMSFRRKQLYLQWYNHRSQAPARKTKQNDQNKVHDRIQYIICWWYLLQKDIVRHYGHCKILRSHNNGGFVFLYCISTVRSCLMVWLWLYVIRLIKVSLLAFFQLLNNWTKQLQSKN